MSDTAAEVLHFFHVSAILIVLFNTQYWVFFLIIFGSLFHIIGLSLLLKTE